MSENKIKIEVDVATSPGHMVATTKGFIAAKDLCVGDVLCGYGNWLAEIESIIICANVKEEK